MAEVWIPRQLQGLTKGQAQVQAGGETVRQVIQSLESTYPGIIDFLCDANGIAPNMAVVVDGETSYLGLLEKVQENSEIHFLPAIGGGQANDRPVILAPLRRRGSTTRTRWLPSPANQRDQQPARMVCKHLD